MRTKLRVTDSPVPGLAEFRSRFRRITSRWSRRPARYDFEKGKWSYLHGEELFGGWWYYYLYAMAVKMPVGTLFLIALAKLPAGAKTISGRRRSSSRPRDDSSQKNESFKHPSCILHSPGSFADELVVLTPALLVLLLVSSQTGFNRYLRYVLPAFPFLFIWVSQIAKFFPCILRAGTEASRKMSWAKMRLCAPLVPEQRLMRGSPSASSRTACRILTSRPAGRQTEPRISLMPISIGAKICWN